MGERVLLRSGICLSPGVGERDNSEPESILLKLVLYSVSNMTRTLGIKYDTCIHVSNMRHVLCFIGSVIVQIWGLWSTVCIN